MRVNECVYVWFELADVREGGGSDLFADGFVAQKIKKIRKNEVKTSMASVSLVTELRTHEQLTHSLYRMCSL